MTNDSEGGATSAGTEPCPELIRDGTGTDLLIINTMEDALALPPYTRIEGSLHISEIPGLDDLAFLECLTEINGSLSIQSPDLRSLAGLERLERVTTEGEWPPGILTIWANPRLESVDALTELEHVDGLRIYENDALVSLAGLTRLASAGTVEIWDNSALEVIGLRQLATVETFDIAPVICEGQGPLETPRGNPSLVRIDGLDSLVQFDDIYIAGNDSLSELDGLAHLADASGARNLHFVLNASLPHQHILEIQTLLGDELGWVCGNLDDPESCQCL